MSTDVDAGAGTTSATPKYAMTVDLSVLESLGINLYSNAAAVLSELVANAYDADATSVAISWKESGERIVVVDNGAGMTVDEINNRFLAVGYKKRDTEGFASPGFHRPFMGRKGIGKLSVFSIAKSVSIFTTKNGESNGLVIDVAALKEAIDARKDYYPDPVKVPAEHRAQGTVLVLDELVKSRAALTANALRKRLARRFDVLDDTKPEDGGFEMSVNSKPITYLDRQELRKLEYIWEFGEARLPDAALPKGVTRFVLLNDTVEGDASWKVRGWIGTAKVPTDLTTDEEAGSLRNVIVLARKRPIQEGIIEKLDFSRIFGSYVTGQIEADFLDLDGGYADIATSDRQRLIEDDPRVVGLQKLLRTAFKDASEIWSAERPKKEAKDTLAAYPRLRQWVDEREPWQQTAARTMVGTIASLPMEEDREIEDRLALLRAGVLAFERTAMRKGIEDLEELSTLSAEGLLALLGRQDNYETALWGDILKSRLEAIDQLQLVTDKNELEKILQQLLFERLWLLDPGWERATLSPKMEENLRKISPGLFPEHPETGEELTGRIDIRYATLSGRHVIVELKRYLVKTEADVLAEQGLKYWQALNSLLRKENKPDPDIEVVFVLGEHPGAAKRGNKTAKEYCDLQFATFNGRYVLYDELIANARNQYQEYLDATAAVETLNGLLDSLQPPNPEPGAKVVDGTAVDVGQAAPTVALDGSA